MTEELSLEKVVKTFSKNQVQDNYNKVLLAIVDGAKKGSSIHLPVKFKQSKEGELIIEPGMVQGTDRKYYYIACTYAAETEELNGESFVVMTIENLLRKASGDKEMGGICIDPWGEGNCFIPRQYIELLLNVVDSEGES